ncbi:MAG: hypothetical protein HC772_08650 [Leptolyngbyaceae cyanobacterium CRU_2_3]|nr:hypothetical protein [Leptolyngbyaceae cyanobacterium CRU_2_3]
MNSPKYQNSQLMRLGAIALSSLAFGGFLLSAATPVAAQAAYGSYIGVGGSVNVANDSSNGGNPAGGVVAIRYRLLEVPISLRAQALISDRTAIVPTVSYDVPLNWQTDAYIGAGVAFQGGSSSNTNSSPLGDQTSFVLQPGIDYSFPSSNLVLFGNAIIAFDAYKNSGGTAASVQGGLGLRF